MLTSLCGYFLKTYFERLNLKPLFDVQLLRAFSLGSWRDYRCQSVCVTSLQKCRLTKN